MLKKYLLSLCLILFLVQVPAFCEENSTTSKQPQDTVEQNIDDTTNYAEEESIKTTPMTGEIDSRVARSPYENNFQEKIPEQNEFTKAIFMFLKTMFAVAICSIFIYIILLGIRKFYGAPTQKPAPKNEVEDNLKSTQNETEALQIFFNKTKNL